MGTGIELNDTLQLSNAQGFPADVLNLERHRSNPIKLEDVCERTFEFANKDGARVFHLDPVRVYLVQNLNGKWLFWGHVMIQSQSISKASGNGSPSASSWVTSGTYKIVDLYDPEYQEAFTRRESPPGKSYF
jgi:hypothetical protein